MEFGMPPENIRLCNAVCEVRIRVGRILISVEAFPGLLQRTLEREARWYDQMFCRELDIFQPVRAIPIKFTTEFYLSCSSSETNSLSLDRLRGRSESAQANLKRLT